jgi:thiol-disulfide isomerase/thioredoxin
MSRDPFNRFHAPRLAVAIVLLSAVPALAQMPADAVFQGFEPSGDYVFELGGKDVAGAEVYHSERAVAYLVTAPPLRSPLLVSPRTGAVESVALMKVAKREDGTIDLLADASFNRVDAFKIDGESVVFTVNGQKAKLKPRPWLLGLHDTAGVKGSNPEYGRKAALYKPNTTALAALRAEKRDVRVRVYFGSWCPHCKEHVPFVLRVAEELKGSKIRFEYYGLPRPFSNDPEAIIANVHGVPTGIVFVDGKEVGRIDTRDWQTPETAINKLIHG